MAVLAEEDPAAAPGPEMDGSLLNPVAELWEVAGPSPFFWTCPPPPAALPDPADFSPPDGPLMLWGLPPAPRAVPWDVPGAFGWRTARGPLAAPAPAELIRPVSRVKPVDPSFLSMTRLPLRGCTVILFPAGLRLGVLLVMLIRFRLLRESPRRALDAM